MTSGTIAVMLMMKINSRPEWDDDDDGSVIDDDKEWISIVTKD